MQDLEYIDDYFKGALPKEETGRFEQRILSEPPFAEAVSFYCMATQAAKEQLAPQKKQRFRELYQQYTPPAATSAPSLVRRLLPYMAAAAVLAAIFIGWYVWLKPVPPQQMADTYIKKELSSFGVSMGSRQDSLQNALQLYNERKDKEALQQFENMLAANATDATALRYAGIVSLRLGLYDKALQYFRQLEQYPGLYSNPGKFYYALTLMKRNAPGDASQARQLLQQVAQSNDLDGKKQAQQWLKQW
jgi:tetratricopeptide (TPR) repeat protein